MSRRLCALVLLCAACGDDTTVRQTLDVRLPSDKSLLAGVATLSLRAERDGVVLAQKSFPASTHSLALDGVPFGARTIFTLDGLSSSSDLVARGSSCEVDFTGQGPPISLYFAPANFFTPTAGPPIAVRRQPIALPLANGDVLVAGGQDMMAMPETALKTAEVFTTSAATFSAALAQSLDQPRQFAEVATVAGTGSLIVGGYGQDGHPVGGAELFVTTFTPVDDMGRLGPRAGHRVAVGPTGEIWVTGGLDGSFQTLADTLTVDVLSPTSINVTAQMPLNKARHDHAMVVAAGIPMVIGGYDETGAPLDSIEVFDGTRWQLLLDNSGTMTPFHLLQPRAEMTATLLDDGTVLIVGGVGGTGASLDVLDDAEIFNPVTRSSTSIKLEGKRHGQTATPLPGGRVLVAGGGSDPSDTPLDTVELFSLAVGQFVNEHSLNEKRYGHVAVPLCDGTVLIVGGGPGAEIYSPPPN